MDFIAFVVRGGFENRTTPAGLSDEPDDRGSRFERATGFPETAAGVGICEVEI